MFRNEPLPISQERRYANRRQTPPIPASKIMDGRWLYDRGTCTLCGASRAGNVKAGRHRCPPLLSRFEASLDGPEHAGHACAGRRGAVVLVTSKLPLVKSYPADTGELVGRRVGEHVVVRPFPGGFDPRA